MDDVLTRRLFRAARNQLFSCVQQARLRSEHFEWDPPDVDMPGVVFHLVHRPTGFWFQGRSNRDDGMNVSYWPGNTGPYPVERNEYELDWSEVLIHFRGWTSFVKAEHETPDLWEIAADAQLTTAPFETSDNNHPFTVAEQRRVKIALDEFRQHVEATNDLTEPQKNEVRRRFQYLASAAGRLGRLDWFEMLVSNIVGLALGRVLDAKTVTDAMHIAHRLFGWVLVEGAKLLGG